MVKYPSDALCDDGMSLTSKFSDIAWAIWEKVEGQSEHRTQPIM